MRNRREGEKNNFFFVAFLSIFLVTSTILLPIFTLTSTNDQITCEKSTAPNSNNSLVNTTLLVLVNSVPISDISTTMGEKLNITVFFSDNNSIPLNGATINITWGGFTYILDEDIIKNQYNFTLDTNDLEIGPNILTISAQLDGYQTQTIHFLLLVEERATELILFVNGNQVNQSATVQFEANELINITVFYRDYLTDTHLSGANVELLGVNNLTEIGLQFNITINSNDLETGINFLEIYAQLLTYQLKSIQFFIEVVERATRIQLYLNGVDKTYDPVLELPIGTLINITVKYYDNRTGLEIPNAVVDLIGESLSENLTESLIFNQYSIILNSSNLLIGENLFIIIAQALTYQIDTVLIRITVNKIATNISGNSIIDVLAGETIHIEVELTDLDFGGPIIGVTVTYTWQFGQGVLTDLNSDGIYEVNLISTMVGIYSLEITADKGDNYEFESFQITLIITNTFEVIILSSDADNPDSDGTFYLLWISLENADNYSIYVYNSNITQINSSLTLLDVQIDNSAYLISGLPDGTYYYIIVAFNEYGNTSSNCIQVIVSGNVDEDIIPGYNLFTLISMILILSVIIIQKQLKHKNKRS